MKQITFMAVAMLISSGILFGQGIAINTDGSDPNTSAMLDVQSTDKGILIPRLTNAGITALGATLGAADKGMIIFNSDDTKFEYWNGSSWKTMVTKSSSSGSSSDGSSFCSEGVTDYDGNHYKTVKIGSQCWMAENLISNHYADGATISSVYNYNNDYGNGLTFGYLYSWYSVMRSSPSSNGNPSGVQGVCPDGWHVPSDAEWRVLEMTLGMTSGESNLTGYRGSYSVGRKLKATENAFLWTDHANRGTNTSGFTALPAGHHWYGAFTTLLSHTYFWTTTEDAAETTKAWQRSLSYSSDQVGRNSYHKQYGHSCRCVKD